MLSRCDSPDLTEKAIGVISGFNFFQSAMCGYNSCVSPAAHYHCQICGFATSELSHTSTHRETCSRVLKNRYSQSPCLQQGTGNTQGSDQSLATAYDPGPESTMPVGSIPPAIQMSNSGNHLYYRTGSQQSSMFNPLLSSQSQPLYSGVFGSQVGFSSQNNFPSSFSGFAHMEPPPWLSESRMSSSANSTPSLENGRTSKALSCSSQGMSHSCCGSRVGGLLENIGLCSPLSTDTYKSLSKDSAGCQHKSAISMENQNWFCGQGMLGYGSQVSGQGIQNSMFKCSEPFPSCTMSQLGIPMNDPDLKHSGTCYDPNTAPKQTNSFMSSRKLSCLEVSKDHCSKFHSQKTVDMQNQNSLCKEQENNTFDGHPVMFGSVDNEIHEEMYSQNSVVMQSVEDRSASVPYNQLNKNGRHSQTSILEINKSFGVTPSSQTQSVFSRCNLPACEALDGYLQLEGQPLYQYPQIAPVSSNIEDDQASNQGSCSGAAESDIIVEESEEEVMGSEVSVEDVKSHSQSSCLVCNSLNVRFVHVSGIAPITSTSHVPVVKKLAEIITFDCNASLTFRNEFICRRCLNLVDTLDSLENKLASVKQNLIELYKRRDLLAKSSEVSNVISERAMCENGSSNDQDVSNPVANSSVSSEVEIEKVELIDQNNCSKDDDGEKKEVGEASGSDIKETSLCIVGDEFSITSEEEEVEETNDSPDESIVCNICNKVFTNRENLNIHFKQEHTKSLSYFCDQCGRGFLHRAGLEKHLLSHAPEYRCQCEVCGKCFVQGQALEDHLRKHRGAFRLSCVHCKKGFLYASSLQVHERTHTGERPFVCQHCGKTFISGSNLTSHLQLCSGDKSFSCDHCDKKFSSSTQLKAHVIISHESDPRHKCDVCGKVFVKPCDLKVHSRSHSGEKPHRCEICGKCYSNVGNLNQHAKKHNKEQQFKCDVCEKGFLRKALLERHKNKHTGERPFPCRHCDKLFASSRDLHSHTKLHMGTMKKYTCPVCGKVMNHGLKVHMRTHSGDRPYSCSECNSSFSVKSTLDKHIKLKHQHVT